MKINLANCVRLDKLFEEFLEKKHYTNSYKILSLEFYFKFLPKKHLTFTDISFKYGRW